MAGRPPPTSAGSRGVVDGSPSGPADPDTGTRDALPPQLPSFPYQLVDAYMLDCSVTRSAVQDSDPERPIFVTGLATTDRDEPPGFDAQLAVEVRWRFRPEYTCAVKATTLGVFLRQGDVDPDSDARFRSIDCAVLLWPYVRAVVAELVRMTGLQLAPLPTIDVRAFLDTLPG